MVLSCQNQIYMARSYTQCLPKIAQRVKDYEQFAIDRKESFALKEKKAYLCH